MHVFRVLNMNIVSYVYVLFSDNSAGPEAGHQFTQHKKVSNHHANLPLEMYSFTL